MGTKHLDIDPPTRILRDHAVSCFKNMHGRCEIPSMHGFKHYGGRGISVCPEWATFAPFLRDMGLPPTAKHTVGRIDSDKNYAPGNCRWETHAEQQRNKRTSLKVVWAGKEMHILDWCDLMGFSQRATVYRLARQKGATAKTIAAGYRRYEYGRQFWANGGAR